MKTFRHQTNNDKQQQHFERRFSQGKTQNNGHLSNSFQTRKSLDQPALIHDNQAHEVNITNQVQFNARGHY